MNRNVQIIIGILVLIVLGAGGFFLYKNSSKVPSMMQDSKTSVSSNQPSSSKTLKDLFSSGTAQKCTYKNVAVEGTDVEGVAYVANGMMRTDASINTSGTTTMSHIIVKDKTTYAWADGQTTGIKMSFDPNEMMKEEPTGTSTQEAVDLNKQVDLNCSGWTVEDSVFAPPANIKFTEMGSMMSPTGSAGGSKTAPQNNCAICSYLTGDDKAQCLAQLNCN